MSRFKKELTLAVPAAEAFAYHARNGALARLSPPWERMRVLAQSGGIKDGGVMKARLLVLGGWGPIWEARHHGYEEGKRFMDTAIRSPFRKWEHQHVFEGSRLCDDITYRLPFGALGEWIVGTMVQRRLDRMFDYRHAVTAQDLARLAQFPQPLRVAISGASGLIGTALGRFLTLGGHEVVPLVRLRASKGIFWNPEAGEIDAASLEGFDAVVHLAGEGIADGRWTEAFKRRVLESRTKGTRLLSTTLARATRPPRVLVSASAIGFYGDGGDALLDEAHAPGSGFLSEICTQWEAAAQPARDAGIRVVHPRIGIVLDPHGGALPQLMRPLHFGASAQIGDGRQWQSWIGLDDVVYALHFCLAKDAVTGPLNFVTPHPLEQRELVRTLARLMQRPALAFVPKAAAALLFGREKAEQLFFASQRAQPKALVDAGYRFWHPELEGLLRFVLGRSAN